MTIGVHAMQMILERVGSVSCSSTSSRCRSLMVKISNPTFIILDCCSYTNLINISPQTLFKHYSLFQISINSKIIKLKLFQKYLHPTIFQTPLGLLTDCALFYFLDYIKTSANVKIFFQR